MLLAIGAVTTACVWTFGIVLGVVNTALFLFLLYSVVETRRQQ